MAESAHIEILRRGARAWNAWRDHYPSRIAMLDHAALSLAERQFAPINGGPINLRSASMRGAHLRFASLSKAYLEASDLSEADLAYARLDGANMAGANLSYAVLDHADFNGALLSRANLTGANLLHFQNLTQAQINNSLCDTSTIFPAHLVHPITSLKVVRRAPANWGDRNHVSALATNSRN